MKKELEEGICKLYALAERAKKVHMTCTLTDMVAESSRAVCGILTILGLALAPVTAGGNSVLLAAGLGWEQQLLRLVFWSVSGLLKHVVSASCSQSPAVVQNGQRMRSWWVWVRPHPKLFLQPRSVCKISKALRRMLVSFRRPNATFDF